MIGFRSVSRPAFGRADVLIGLGLLAGLGLLLVPALLRSRTTADRTRCAGQLHRIGLAFHAHQDVLGFLPSNGGDLDGDSSPDVRVFVPGQVEGKRLGVGDPTRGGREQPGSWAFALLPFVGAEQAFRGRDVGATLEQYACPARRTGRPQTCPETDPVFAGWRYQCGGLNPWTKTDYAANFRLIGGRGASARLGDLTPGTTNLMLIGEKTLDVRAYQTGGWRGDEPALTGGGTGTARDGGKMVADAVGADFDNHWGSAHPGVCLLLFADGRVGAVPFDVAPSRLERWLKPPLPE